MNEIDHAILIPHPAPIVWAYVGDVSQHPRWQVGCTSVTFLTSLTKGAGTRWRATLNGRDYVLEATAWYDNVGYEYVIVDGGGYQRNRGRIRLQEAAEGTVVQWTFSYDLSGPLSGLRNSLSFKRQLRNDITESLRNLYTYVMEERRTQSDAGDSKVLMRDAPDVGERASYVPRHASSVENEVEEPLADPDSLVNDIPPDELAYAPQEPESVYAPREPLNIPEPPIAADDTRPNPSVQGDPSDEAPTFNEPPLSSEDTPPSGSAALADPWLTESQRERRWSTYDEPSDPYPSEPTRPEPPTMPAREGEPFPPTPPRRPSDLPEPEPTDDTSQVSVFELFGLSRPSETQEMRQASAADSGMPFEVPPSASQPWETAPHTTDATITAPGGGRLGLRLRQRRKNTKVRRP